MTNKERLVIRLEEQVRIYKDSPNVAITYIDMARIVEDFLEVLGVSNIEGFNHKT